MKIRKVLAGWAFGLMLGGVMFTSADAQDTKAEKKAKKAAGKGKDNKDLVAKSDTAMIPVEAKPSLVASFASQLDAIIDAKMKGQKLTASPVCSDEDFIHRASLDIAGVIPTPERVRAFIATPESDKRAKLVEELLASDKFGAHFADIWANLLFPADSGTRYVNKGDLAEYLKESFNAGKTWNKTVYETLTAHGEVDKHKEGTYFLANHSVDKLTDNVSKVFMGLQLQCAQCHNHPFAEWTQKEYWGLAEFFMKVQAPNPQMAEKQGLTISITEVNAPRRNDKMNTLPESARIVPPKFPGGKEVTITAADPARPYLARWLTGPDNPYFAKAFVNRVWFQFFGRGIVNPVDNLDEQAKSIHPELLNVLAKEFVAGGYDVKHLIQIVCATQAYQRSSKPTAGNDKDHEYFSHMAMKVMSPEQLYDSLHQVLAFRADAAKGKAAGGMKGGPKTPRDQFVTFFNGSETAKPVDYEAGIPQALRLMNNAKMNPKTATDKLTKAGMTNAQAIEQLYLTAYARKPTSSELAKMESFVAKQTTKAEAYGDILWVLLNSSEFTLIR